jgi:hypothetical protein
MNDLGLGSLASVHVVGQYGTHLTALIWLTITATLMYVGPATYSLIYLLFFNRIETARTSNVIKVDSDTGETIETNKAA